MAYLDNINAESIDYAMNAFSNLLIANGNASNSKTITFPIGYNTEEGSNMTFRAIFPNGHTGQSNLTINGEAVVVNKYGTLTPLPYYNINSAYKSIQENTILEMYHISDYDGHGTSAFVVVGNPIVLSSNNYTIYANGEMGGCPPIDSVYVQYPQCEPPSTIWFLTTWSELNYGGAFFRSNHGNASTFIEKNGNLVAQGQATAKNGLNASKTGSVTGVNQTISGGAHKHSIKLKTIAPIVPGQDMFVGALDSNITIYTENDGSHEHSFTPSISDTINVSLSSTDDETRPINYTMKIWKRTA